MNSPKIHCRDGINAVIPEHLQNLKIDAGWLTTNRACAEGRKALLTRFPQGASYSEVRAWIAEIQYVGWEAWLLKRVGGDTATAGDYGTATAGDYGTATAGYRGTATAGDCGTATAGNRGTATAGNRGTATAGYRGTATAGDYGTATAGYGGTATAGDCGTATAGYGGALSILFYDPSTGKYRRVVAAVGEGGLKPNVAYKLDIDGNFAEV